MKEYNWREERKKFQTNLDQSAAAGQAQIQTPVQNKAPQAQFPVFKLLSSLLTLVTVAAVAVWLAVHFSIGRDSSMQLAAAAEKYKGAVGLVTTTIEFSSGQKITSPVGTAWAFSPTEFATNAHVANGIKSNIADEIGTLVKLMALRTNNVKSVDELVKKLGEQATKELLVSLSTRIRKDIRRVSANIIINSSAKQSYNITHVKIHPNYDVIGSAMHPDVAVLVTGTSHSTYFPIAPDKKLHALKSGTPVAFLGFPIENLTANNVNMDNPVASMQSGIVVAVSDFQLKNATPESNYLIRHNLPAIGGASGSPIFNSKGEAVALMFGVNMIGQVKNGTVQRAPSAAQINFAVRADLLRGVGEPVKFEDFIH